ncbi:MAG TPA: TIR domain-containing protein [Sphingomicrobium sp.]|nr:TIR domain-containing protein [Sphingomicrobium sp.]
MAKVFLSYARDDAAAAKQLAECIGRAGHEVWWDRHIQGGSRFASEIDRELKSAQAVVVLWTESSIDSAWVQDEAAEGRDSGRLVPVTMNGCRPPLGFRQFQSVDLEEWSGKEEPQNLSDLLEAVAKVAGSNSSAGPKSRDQGQEARRGTSVCVLPFVNMSGDPEQEYFSDGITEDIITDLSKVSALLVIARNTAFTFKGRVMDVKEVAQALDVSHVLEGSVRKAGDRVRITAQLIDVATGGHLWADRYDRDLTDIFAIQDEISRAIVAALRVKLLPAEKKAIETRGTANVDAYNLYLMARQHWTGGASGDVRRDQAIVRICQQAVALDPNYAQAWALMALAQSELRFEHAYPDNPLLAAERALALNPDLPEARCAMARNLEEEGRTEEANREIQEALRLDPESWEVNREAARLMFRQGRITEAIPFFAKAASLIDSDWHNAGMLTTCYGGSGEVDELRKAAELTLDRCKTAIAKDPGNGSAIAFGAIALGHLGEAQRAKEWARRALLLDPDNLTLRYNLACGLALDPGSRADALEALHPYFERINSSTHIKHLEADPDLDPIRGDPRFGEMLAAAKQRLGMPETPAVAIPSATDQ